MKRKREQEEREMQNENVVMADNLHMDEYISESKKTNIYNLKQKKMKCT